MYICRTSVYSWVCIDEKKRQDKDTHVHPEQSVKNTLHEKWANLSIVCLSSGLSWCGVMSGGPAAWTGDWGPGGVQRGHWHGKAQRKNMYREGYVT